MSGIGIIILCILIIAFVFVILQIMRSTKIPSKQSIVAWVGTLGSGKTYLAVRYGKKAYRKQETRYFIYKMFKWLPKSDKIFKDWKYPPTLYSNIPIRINKKTLSTPLTKEMLLERGILPEKCVVVIDEIGAIASQWEFDNPYVQEQLEKFVRFFRHWLDGRMFVTDQVATNIVKPIRSRLGMIYGLHDFHRYGAVLPFYKVTAIPMLLVEDNNNIMTTTELDENYFFGFLPYLKKHGSYNSRCYKPIYRGCAVRKIDHFDDSLYTKYLIDISVSKAIQKDYQNNKEKYKEYLYRDIKTSDEVEKDDDKTISVDVPQV